MRENKSVSMKVVCLLLAIVLLIGCVAGGTLAYLFTQTPAVKNTFAASTMELTLAETTGNSYKLIPGKTYAKDPEVTLTSDIDCYLFIKVEEKENSYLTYTLALKDTTEWTPVPGTTNVYYRTVAADATNKSWYLLKGQEGYPNGYVTIKDNLELGNMTAAVANSELTFTAYAVQEEGLSVADAWAQAQTLENSNP